MPKYPGVPTPYVDFPATDTIVTAGQLNAIVAALLQTNDMSRVLKQVGTSYVSVAGNSGLATDTSMPRIFIGDSSPATVAGVVVTELDQWIQPGSGPSGGGGGGSTPYSLTIGNVTTLGPGVAATAALRGTSPNQILDLGIPQGATGSSGGGGGTGTLPWRSVAAGANIQTVLDQGPGVVVLGPGNHTISTPLILRAKVMLWGSGGATHLIAGASGMASMINVGNGGSIDRWQIAYLVIDCEGKAGIGIDINVTTTAGNDKGEPDSQGQIENIYINDATQYGIYSRNAGSGLAIYGRRIRIRRAGTYGYYLQGPDSYWTDCEATQTGGGGAGFYINCSNNHFMGCKAWYCHGYGFDIHGNRNTFSGCEVQDIAQHGWNIQTGNNVFASCSCDTAARPDIGGAANSWDGFYIASGLTGIAMTGCISYDKHQGYAASNQRYGFNIPAAIYNSTPVSVIGLNGYGNVTGLLNLR